MLRYPREPARRRLQSATAIGASLSLAALAMTAGPAQATTITDPTGDFLSTFSGPTTGPDSGQYDVLSVSAVQNGANVTISATMAGPATATAYVLGINRGAGAAFLDTGPTPVGAGVLFDSVAILLPGGGSFVDNLLPTSTVSPLSNVTFSGDSFTAVIPFADLPGLGFTTGNYLYNLWPRDGLNAADNTQISDFAPDASSFAASFVPEPASWALMLAGLGMLGAGLRSRRTLAAA
jgi:PEP-CTERM motif